jgi:hypothetical protein
MGTFTNNKRVYERFSARFPVKFQHAHNGYGSDVFLRDASARGARITSKQRLYLHDGVSLDIELPDGKGPLQLNGWVVWTKVNGPDLWDAGLEFHKIDFMKIHRLYRFVEPL